MMYILNPINRGKTKAYGGAIKVNTNESEGAEFIIALIDL